MRSRLCARARIWTNNHVDWCKTNIYYEVAVNDVRNKCSTSIQVQKKQQWMWRNNEMEKKIIQFEMAHIATNQPDCRCERMR